MIPSTGLRINDNDYTWTDDTAVLYTNWGPSQPNNTVGLWCGTITKASSWTWSDTDCKRELPYICEYGKRRHLRYLISRLVSLIIFIYSLFPFGQESPTENYICASIL